MPKLCIALVLERRMAECSDEELTERWQWVPWVMDELSDLLAQVPRFAELFREDFEALNEPPKWNDPFPSSLQAFLDDPEQRYLNAKWLGGLRDCLTPDELGAIESAAFQGNYQQMRRAFDLLHAVKRPDILWAAIEHHLSHSELRLDRRQSIAVDLQARRLPAERVLPTAREWLHSSVLHQRLFAETAIHAHAEKVDRQALLEKISGCIEPFRSRSLYHLISPLAKFKHAGPLPIVETVFELAPNSSLRYTAAEALAHSDPRRFEETFAFECLWDSGELVRSAGKWSVKPTCPRAARRIERLRKRPKPEPYL